MALYSLHICRKTPQVSLVCKKVQTSVFDLINKAFVSTIRNYVTLVQSKTKTFFNKLKSFYEYDIFHTYSLRGCMNMNLINLLPIHLVKWELFFNLKTLF